MIIINLLRNKIKRIESRKDIIFSLLLVIPVVVIASFLFTSSNHVKYNVAVVTNQNKTIPQSERYLFTKVDKDPGVSALAIGKYDFTAVEKGDGTYAVNTVLKSREEKQMVEEMLNTGKIAKSADTDKSSRGLGVSILGLIMMFAIIESTTLTVFYPDDISFKTLKRIFTTEATENQYIISQFIVTFTGIFISSFAAAVLAKIICGLYISYSIGKIAVLIAILTALVTAFALFISTVMKENIQIASCCIAIITCLLGGCFFKFSTGIKVIDSFCSIIPVKSYMNLASCFEMSSGIMNYKMDIINILLWTVAMFVSGIYITKRKLKKGNFN